MGKLLLDSSTTWQEPVAKPLDIFSPIDLNPTAEFASDATDDEDDVWGNVPGLESQQLRGLRRLYAKGVLWKRPVDGSKSCSSFVVFRLKHGGEVSSDGNCLFTSMEKAMGSVINGKELRKRAVERFLENYGSGSAAERTMIEDTVRHMYSPDLKSGWGIHVVQEIKLLAKKEDREALDSAIDELVQFGLQREYAAESIYKERCIAVEDAESWGMYMLVSGSLDDKHHIITLQYTEDGLLSVDENRQGRAAAFGDDMALECLATEFKREIYVVQAHGSDGMVDEENCVFFLPHRPRGEICEQPIFLFMKGTGWCSAGGDHYEPLIAHASAVSSTQKGAFVL